MNTQIYLNETLAKQALQYSEQQNIEQLVNQLLLAFVQQHANQVHEESNYQKLMQQLSYVETGRKFSREEMNER